MTPAGSLDELPLLDVLQLLTVAGRSGTFRLADGSHQGHIVLSHGEIVEARIEELSGEAALNELTLWSTGRFEFEASEVAFESPTIKRTTTALLADAAHRLDEWQAIRKTVPSVSSTPCFVEDAPASNIVLTPSEWAVVRNIDGARTVRQVADAVKKSLFETCSSLRRLVDGGLVVVAEQESEVAPRGEVALV
ncbi:MAG: DUF4388 domain-containing protein [Acidobacteriota bacterium]|nr:DUF4388 domain-containing protein [Acidobacteriota bacterium]